MPFVHPHYLVETDWLAARLGDPKLRILDCTVLFRVEGAERRVASGRETWQHGHIPGSGFADLLEDLSDRETSLPFMMPPARQFAEVMGQYGIGDDAQVVLYDACGDQWAHMWATRLWWMLRACGFERAAVLNGGLHKWRLEGRPLATNSRPYPPARFTPTMRPGLLVGKSDVLAVIGNRSACLLNALSAEDHAGNPAHGDRAGHIPSSVNVPAVSLIDPVTHAYLPAEELRARFEAAGALDGRRVITYCGGGISATSDAFILTLLGAADVAVYDGSLSEWRADPSLPMETLKL